MIVDEIRKRLHAEFQPFALHLSNGRKFNVPHPDFIAVSPKTVVVIGEDGLSNVINPLHIVTIEDSSSRQAA
jgi:hypothetical protein